MGDGHLGAQTVRRGGVGPVRSLLGGKTHRPLFSDSPFGSVKEVGLGFSAKCARRKPGKFFDALRRGRQPDRDGFAHSAGTRYGTELPRAVTACGALATTTTASARLLSKFFRFALRVAGDGRRGAAEAPRRMTRHETCATGGRPRGYFNTSHNLSFATILPALSRV